MPFQLHQDRIHSREQLRVRHRVQLLGETGDLIGMVGMSHLVSQSSLGSVRQGFRREAVPV